MKKEPTRRQQNEKRNKALRKKQSTISGRKPERDAKYLKFIRQFLCVRCYSLSWFEILRSPLPLIRHVLRDGNFERTQACHMGPHGIGQKASDYAAIPMCASHHERFGSKAPPGIDLSALQKKLREAYEDRRAC